MTLATFHFLVLQTGTIAFRLHSNLFDPNEELFFLDGTVADLSSATTVNVVPEPGTLGLMALSAGILMARARRRLR